MTIKVTNIPMKYENQLNESKWSFHKGILIRYKSVISLRISKNTPQKFTNN